MSASDPKQTFAKAYPLAALAVISFVVPALEVIYTGRIEPMGRFDGAEALLSITAIYWWYHLDKSQRGYEAAPLMNVAIVALSVLALPVYFVKSRGWKAGGLATAMSIAVLIALGMLGMFGEFVG